MLPSQTECGSKSGASAPANRRAPSAASSERAARAPPQVAGPPAAAAVWPRLHKAEPSLPVILSEQSESKGLRAAFGPAERCCHQRAAVPLLPELGALASKKTFRSESTPKIPDFADEKRRFQLLWAAITRKLKGSRRSKGLLVVAGNRFQAMESPSGWPTQLQKSEFLELNRPQRHFCRGHAAVAG